MAETNDNPLARFERHPTDYILWSAGVAVFVCLAAAGILTITEAAWIATAAVVFGTLLLAAFIFLMIARERRQIAASSRRLSKWHAA